MSVDATQAVLDHLLPAPALAPAIVDPYEHPASELVRPAREIEGPAIASMVGVPFDTSIMGRRGAKSGPEAVRWGLNAALLYEPNLGIDLADGSKVADFGDVDVVHTDVDRTWDRVSDVTEALVRLGRPLLAIGGDHGLAYPLIRGVCRATGARLGVISVDAHLDFRISHHGEKSSGVPFRYMLDTLGDQVSGSNFVEFGIGGWLNTRRYHQDLLDNGVHIVTQREIHRSTAAEYDALVGEAIERAADGVDALYLTFDIDAIDGAVVGATNVPGVGGITAWQALELVHAFAAHPKAIGMDIMEVSPAWDRSTMTERMAASLALNFFAGCHGKGA
jgi:formimidoylglutamase